MKHIFILLFASLWLFLPNSLYAQPLGGCGTKLDTKEVTYLEQTWKARKQREAAIPQEAKSMEHFIPIQVHIIRSDAGTGGLSISTLNTALGQLNDAFAPNNMVFYQCGDPLFIDSTPLQDITRTSTEIDNMVTANNIAGVINIYFTNIIRDDEGNTIGGYATFPWKLSEGRDEIVIDEDLSFLGNTFIHEMGHYLSLLHTHETARGTELVSRFPGNCCNCESAGDELCDTAADPCLSSSTVDLSCNYTGSALDDCDAAYNPPTTNYMSYSTRPCRSLFSPQQYARMLSCYLNDRAYLDESGCCPGDYELISPRDNILSGVNVKYEVSDFIEASNTIEIGTVVQYDAGNYILLLPGFVAEGGVEFEAYIDGCGGKLNDTPIKPTTPTATPTMLTPVFPEHQTPVLQTIRNYPNPFIQATTIEYNLLQEAKVNLLVLDLTGQQVAQLVQNITQPKGVYQVQFDGSHLPSGIYYYTIQINEQLISQKMVIAR